VIDVNQNQSQKIVQIVNHHVNLLNIRLMRMGIRYQFHVRNVLKRRIGIGIGNIRVKVVGV